ncbi:MAG: hypothetical protein PHW64_03235 [Sulfuricurvum sp.]|nr:hypothetical protein [Sulfuricurvum sp.]
MPDEKKAYLLKRAIELSIEHLMIEMADDAKCAAIIDERMNEGFTLSLDWEKYKHYKE